MDVSVSHNQDNVNFTINGEIDEQGAEEIKTKFLELDKSAFKNVTFDFARVSHIGSAGIGKLLLIYKDIAINGGEVRVINLSEAIYTLFLTLKLNSVFTITKA